MTAGWASQMEDGWAALAWWAATTPRPAAPELVPGLPGCYNLRLVAEYRERLVAWKVGRAEALARGLALTKRRMMQ